MQQDGVFNSEKDVFHFGKKVAQCAASPDGE
jgi:hypothetical protein